MSARVCAGQHQLYVESVAQRARERNFATQEKIARAQERKKQEISHILRVEAAELAAGAAIWRSRQISEAQQRASTARVNALRPAPRRAMSARALNEHALPHYRQDQLLALSTRHADMDMGLYLWRPTAKAATVVDLGRPPPPSFDRLEFHRPPPVRVPADVEPLYIS